MHVDQERLELASVAVGVERFVTVAQQSGNQLDLVQEGELGGVVSPNRLHIRLGKQNPIVKAFTKMGNALYAFQRRLAPSTPPVSLAAVVAAAPELADWGKAYHEYIDLAQARVDSRALPD